MRLLAQRSLHFYTLMATTSPSHIQWTPTATTSQANTTTGNTQPMPTNTVHMTNQEHIHRIKQINALLAGLMIAIIQDVRHHNVWSS